MEPVHLSDHNKPDLKKLYIAGIAAYIAFFVLSLFFYKERTVFIDNAFHLFYILKNNSLAVQNFRYSAVITQFIPLLAGKASLSLKTVMMLYSSGFILYYFICYLLCGFVLKNYKMGLVLLFSQILFATDSFYWMMSELQQGFGFFAVFFAFLLSPMCRKTDTVTVILLIAGAIAVNFFHPLLAIAVIYTFVFIALNKVQPGNKYTLYVAALACVIVMAAKMVFIKSAYDNKSMVGINNFIYLFPHYFGLASDRKFYHDCVTKFYWIPLCFISCCAVYVLKRKWIPLLYFALSVIGYVLLVNVSYPHADLPDFYIENFYLPLGVILALPFAYEVLPALQSRQLAMVVLLLIIGSGTVRIFNNHEVYSKRIIWEEAFLDKNRDQKMLIDENKVPAKMLILTWGTPYEFWLLSTVKYGKTASIVINKNIEKLQWAHWENEEFLTEWGNFPYKKLRGKYFIFKDTVTNYEVFK